MTTSYLFYGDRQDGPEGLLAMTTSTSNLSGRLGSQDMRSPLLTYYIMGTGKTALKGCLL